MRENIRLRLQLAIMAVPRQQNELYKQSLEAVASWIRSYFDTNAEVTQSFLKSVDELSEVSIYVDVPSQLQSLSMLDKYLNRTPLDVQKVEIEAEKAVDNSPRKEEVKPAPEAKAEEPKTEEKPAEAPAAQPATEPQQ